MISMWFSQPMIRFGLIGLHTALCILRLGRELSWTKVSKISMPMRSRVLYASRRHQTSIQAHLGFQPAHKIRNRASQIFQAACEVPARNRWCLTGTPIQNGLDDYGALLAFVGVPPFVTRDQFRFWVASPVLAFRAHGLRTLRALVRATCLRRTKVHPGLAATLRLPRKAERVEHVELAPGERELYDFFKRRSYLLASSAAAAADPKAGGGAAAEPPHAKRRRRQPAREKRSAGRGGGPKCTGNIVALISVLRLICDHGEALLPRAAREAWQKHDAAVVSWDVLQTVAGAGRRCCVCGRADDVEEAEMRDGEALDLACKMHVMCEGCATAAGTATCPKCLTAGTAPPSVSPGPRGAGMADGGPSSKVSALLRNVLATFKRGPDGSPLVKRYVSVAAPVLVAAQVYLLPRHGP